MKPSHSTRVSMKPPLPTTIYNLGLRMVIMFAILSCSAEAKAQNYVFERLWPQLPQPWYFAGPSGVAVDASGNVIVADTNNDRIQVFDSSGTLLRKWGSSGSGNGQFDHPSGVAVDASGNVIVADTYNQRIQVWCCGPGICTDFQCPARLVSAASSEEHFARRPVFMQSCEPGVGRSPINHKLSRGPSSAKGIRTGFFSCPPHPGQIGKCQPAVGKQREF